MKYDKEAYNVYASKLDARDKFMFELKKTVLALGYVPEEYRQEYKTFAKEGWKSWRCQPKVVKRIKQACRKTRNSVISKQEAGLDDQEKA